MVQTYANRVYAISTNIDDIGWSIFKEGGQLAHYTSGTIFFGVQRRVDVDVDKQNSLLIFISFPFSCFTLFTFFIHGNW
jgi:hypothetical protein